jgi:hypothetical protein
VARGFGKNRVVLALAFIAGAVLVYAWIDGGREPLRDLAEPVAMPTAVPE